MSDHWELETDTLGWPAEPPSAPLPRPRRQKALPVGYPSPLGLGAILGTQRAMAAKTHPWAKLSWLSKQKIRRQRAKGERLKVLAAKFGVSIKTIQRVLSGLRWSEFQPNKRAA